MPTLDLKQLKTHRARTFRLAQGLSPTKRLASASDALRFVNERGFVYFWPIKGIDLPSLWVATAGDRPVADKHDDPGHITWGWKDGALDKRVWYYGKILRRKGTMISLEVAPYFYALSENYGSPEEDYLIAYQEGRLSQSAKQVYETLLDDGAMHTLDLRKKAKLANAKDTEFNKALDQLQADFKILPVGVAQAGAWKYAHIYELTSRHFPELPEQARTIGEAEARQKLTELYVRMVGAVQVRDVTRLFGWSNEIASRTLAKLVMAGALTASVTRKDMDGEWFALPELLA
jgi:hypothetical protein